MKSNASWWRMLTRVAFAATVLGTVRIAAVAVGGTELDCLDKLSPCVSRPFQSCSPDGQPNQQPLCCVGYSSAQTRHCCQYRQCREWPRCIGSGCMPGISQPIQSDELAGEYPNKNCINGRCQ